MLGITEFQERMCRKFGADGCVKVDCDTMVKGGEWIDREADLCGFDFGNIGYAYGLARWMSRTMCARLLEDWQSRPVSVRLSVPEDQTISVTSLVLGGRCVIHRWPHGACGWQYEPTIDKRAPHYEVITFGNWARIPGGGCKAQKRERVALEMARHRKEWQNSL